MSFILFSADLLTVISTIWLSSDFLTFENSIYIFLSIQLTLHIPNSYLFSFACIPDTYIFFPIDLISLTIPNNNCTSYLGSVMYLQNFCLPTSFQRRCGRRIKDLFSLMKMVVESVIIASVWHMLQIWHGCGT